MSPDENPEDVAREMKRTVIASVVDGRRARRRPGRALALLALIAGGCGSLQPIFVPPDPPIVWPSPPDPPRFRWVGEIDGQEDLRQPRSFWASMTSWIAGAEPPASFASAHGVALTPGNVLWVADPESSVVHRLDLETRSYDALGDAGGGRVFTRPIGLAWSDAEQVLLVSDRALGTVTALSPLGVPGRVYGAGELSSPVGVAVGADGRIYVVDVKAHDVKVFAPDGTLRGTFGGRGAGPGQFNYPTYVACDAQGRVLVSDSLNARIQLLAPDGRVLGAWGTRGDAPGDFSQPKGIACDRRGRVFVVDSHFENVQVFDPGGRLLMAIGGEGTGPGEFWLPVGVFVDGEDRVWIADSFNRRVQVLRYIGEGEEKRQEDAP